MNRPRPVIPSGQERMLQSLLEIDPHRSNGWALRGFFAEVHVIRARYAHPREGEALLELGHPAHMAEASFVGQRFAIAFAGDVRPSRLLEAVSQRVADGESRFAWFEPRPAVPRPPSLPRPPPRPSFPELERHAYEAHVKPALRLHVRAEDAPRLAAELERRGSFTAQFQSRVPPRSVLFVARTREIARRLAELERIVSLDVFRRSHRSVEAVRECGLLLGYPSCCANRFTLRYQRSPHPLLPRRRSLAWLAALEAWTPTPHFLLNDALAAQGSAYVSFEPCRYDCAGALREAERIARALGEQNSALRARIDAELRRDVLIVASGQRAVVVLDRDVIESLEALSSPRRAAFADTNLAALRGSRVSPDGRIVGRSDALVIRFASGRDG